MSMRSQWVGASLLATVMTLGGWGLFGGCAPAGGPPVIEMSDGKVSLEDLRQEHDMLNGAGSFDQLPLEDRKAFLSTIADKELLIRIAREETGGLKPPYDRLAREASDGQLLDAFDRLVLWPTVRDSVATMAMAEKMKKEILLHWLVTRSDSVSLAARQEVLAGMPFTDAVRKYSMDDSTRESGGVLPWIGPETLGIEFVKELILEERPAGYISEMRGTPRGFEFFEVQGYRALAPGVKENAVATYPELARLIRSYDRRNEFNDSLKTAHRFSLVPEAAAIVHRCMNAFWDSAGVAGRNAPEFAAKFEPPFIAYDPQELAQTLYTSDGKDVTIREFLESLRTVPITMWPNARKLDTVRAQIERRVLTGWRMDMARAKGLDKTVEFAWRKKYEEEKQLLESFQKDAIAKQITITPEEIQAYYQANLERFRTFDRLRLSYIVFAEDAEARRYQAKAAVSGDAWWGKYVSRFARTRKDLKVVTSSDVIDMTQPFDPEIKAVCEWARDKKVLDVSPVLRTPEGKPIVAMVQMRTLPGIQSLESVSRAVHRTLEDERVNALIDEKLKDARERLKQRVYPERLAEAS